VSFIKSRLRRVEVATRKGPGGRCSECGLSPDGPGHTVLLDEGDPERSFHGDPEECCQECGRRLYFVIEVASQTVGDTECEP
jgi:hypothetical protein